MARQPDSMKLADLVRRYSAIQALLDAEPSNVPKARSWRQREVLQLARLRAAIAAWPAVSLDELRSKAAVVSTIFAGDLEAEIGRDIEKQDVCAETLAFAVVSGLLNLFGEAGHPAHV